MTEQECIEKLRFLPTPMFNNEIDEAKRMAIKSLEKQVAKKPSKDEFDRYICPDCGWIVYTDEYGGRYLTHCENCGQKLDWSDEDDKEG